MGISHLWNQIRLGGRHTLGIPLRSPAGTLPQLCVSRCQHLDDGFEVVGQLFLKIHRAFPGLLEQNQMSHQLTPHMKSAHSPPTRAHWDTIWAGDLPWRGGQDLVPPDALAPHLCVLIVHGVFHLFRTRCARNLESKDDRTCPCPWSILPPPAV